MFTIELPSAQISNITSISGLNLEVAVVEQKVVAPDGKEVIRKLPGRHTASTITVKRPLTQDKSLWDWAKLIADGKIAEARTEGAVVLFDATGTETGRWTFEQAWISKWSASDLDAGSDDPMIEEATIQIEYLKRDK